MSRRLVLRVPNPNAAPARPAPTVPTPPEDAESESGQAESGDAMDVDEGDMDEEGDEVDVEDEEIEEGAEKTELAREKRGQVTADKAGAALGEEEDPAGEAKAPLRSQPPPSRGAEEEADQEVGHGALVVVVALLVRGRAARSRYLKGPKPYRFVNGKALFLQNDELTIDDDPKGDEKIDARGNLLGDREFKAPTFSSPWRDDPERKYMLSIDAARTSGFRDSLYYFRRNPQLLKLPLSQAEKDMLIDIGRLPNSLKSRSVTLITARSAYKVHGAKMIRNGRWVVDDYYEDRVIADGRVAGDLVGDVLQEPLDPEQHHVSNAAPATSAAGGVYRVGGPSTLYGGSGDDTGPSIEIRLAAVREADRELARMRRAALTSLPLYPVIPPAPVVPGIPAAPVAGLEPLDGDSTRLEKRTEVADEFFRGEAPVGWYEPHTGIWHYTQPTRAQLTHAPPTREALLADAVLGGSKIGSNSWGIASVKTFMELPSDEQNPPTDFVWEADDPWAFLEQLAFAAMDVGRLDITDDCLVLLDQQFPDSPRVTILKGQRLEADGMLQDALKMYVYYLTKEDENYVPIRKRLIATLRSLGKITEATEELVKYLDIYYADLEGWLELADIYATCNLFLTPSLDTTTLYLP
ncbi:Chromatin structure-remodeling complex subunit RSC7 AltName: Full=Nuclear protein localization protein 6 [Rhizoctonia solani AG-1 IB]|uniref:ABL042Wp protein n=1 Tax=Thanatephorus cucumeris (strain AG1-IB / isolate 7/3/14) TaxID=1108050 RepID=M5C3U8_THACB|nr:Chromatin structure-remodeling complex subunit RSC7 AltName: Full=Nuclear protein localization protein 6 [Rhizoctonia solani AG-1 IB]